MRAGVELALDPKTLAGAPDRLLAAACSEAALDAESGLVARQRLGEGLAAADRSMALAPDSSEAHLVRA